MAIWTLVRPVVCVSILAHSRVVRLLLVLLWNRTVTPCRVVRGRRRIGKQTAQVVAWNDLYQLTRINVANFHERRFKRENIRIIEGCGRRVRDGNQMTA